MRWRREEQLNYDSDQAVVGPRSELHGYAAKVAFKGRDGRTLIALIDDDCYVGWTEH